MMAASYCPDCDGKIVLSQPRLGQTLTCPHCDTELEVIGLDPLELDWSVGWSDDDLSEDEDEEW